MEYYGDDHFYYSCVFGGTTYTWDGTLVPDPFCCKANKKHPTMLLTQVGSNEKYFIRKIVNDENRLAYYKQLCLTFIDSSNIAWCSDLIYLNDTQKDRCNNYLERLYDREFQQDVNDENTHYAILIPYKDEYQKLENLYDWFESIDGKKDFRNSSILLILLKLLNHFKVINEEGYYFFDMDFARFYISQNNEVYLDFSNLIFPNYPKKNLPNVVKEKYYPLEFMKSSFVLDESTMKPITEYDYLFSVSALVFYMLYHYYPYDGHIFDGLAHYRKFNYNDKIYHKQNVMVFCNTADKGIGTMIQDRDITILWDATSYNLKKLLKDALENNDSNKHVTIDQWIDAINDFMKLKKDLKNKSLRRDRVWKKC